MNKIILISLVLNIGLIAYIIIDMNSRNKEKQKMEISDFKTRVKLQGTVGYTANLVDRLDGISKIVELSNNDVRKAYDASTDHKISKQLALDSVYVIKEWVDRAKKETEDWPRKHSEDLDKALIRE